jgi:putative aldouronate transport system substrate-binding protein
MISTPISRRSLLHNAAGGALLATLLAACSDSPSAPGSAVGNAQLPTYVPFEGIKPDLPGELAGSAGYLSYPASPQTVTSGIPAKGGVVTVLMKLLGGLPPSVDRNAYWQELNKRLGTDLQFQFVPTANYVSKFATTIAGGTLPDLLEVPTPLPPQLPQLLAAECQDLTPFLAGDGILDFPFLANIPTLPWRTCIFNGKIYGVPVPRPVIGNAMYCRTDLLAARGLDPAPANFAEFQQLCSALTDSKNNKWALTRSPGGLVREMLGTPAIWSNDSGTLTHGLERPETKKAIEATAKFFSDGLVHPDAFSASGVTAGKTAFTSGAAALHWDGFSAFGDMYRVSGEKAGAIASVGYDGGDPVVGVQPGSLNFTVLKKASDDRIRELLAILNWHAAPFGSSEYLFRKYGIEGTHYTDDGQNPTITETGTAEVRAINGIVEYHLADGPKVIYNPGFEEATTSANAFAQKLAPFAMSDATVGLYSSTDVTRGAAIMAKLSDVESGIYQGRDTLDDWDDAVQAWRSAGGDQIRAEYEEQLQKAG